MRDGSTEYAVFILFELGMFPIHPLESEERLGSVEIPQSFFYGEKDWMDKAGAERIMAKN